MEESPEPYLSLFSQLVTLPGSFSADAFWGLGVMLLLLFFSAMVSGSEIAFFSLTHHHIDHFKKRRKAYDKTILSLLDRPNLLLATILITNNVVNIAIIVLSSFLLRGFVELNLHPVLMFVLQVAAVSFLILIFAEVLPKVYASRYPVKFAATMAAPLAMLQKVLYPLSTLLVKSTRIIDKRMEKKRPNLSMNELSHAIEITSDESTTEEDKKLLRGIIRFGNIYVREIMKSRVDVVAVEQQTPFKDLIGIIRDAGYSRIPVYRENFDNVAGILYIKDLLPHLGKDNEFKWQELIRNAFFVPESKRINDLLRDFQEKKIHLAIVVDEYGGTAGLVTLEDILEEIVGEINDEFDMEEAIYSKIDANTFIFEGKTLLKDFCKITGADDNFFDAVKGESDTLAGLILEIKQEIPYKGARFSYRQFEFEVEGVDKRRIRRVKVNVRK
ncbi:MAG: gliding motility-associated protein GldE [Bacteroidales bacterium]|nr:gliding motility-associated protein GldE [Bacteroidales bacterium]